MKHEDRVKQFLRNWRGVLLTAPSVGGLIIALRVLGLFQMLEWAAFDQGFRIRPNQEPDPRIAIVAIDETTIRKAGQWPISDAFLAESLKKIRQQNPRAIGLDLYRDLPVEPGNQALQEVMGSTPTLIGVQKVVGDRHNVQVNPPPVLKKLDQVAASDLLLDADGKVRRGLLSLQSPSGEEVISLGATVAVMYLQVEGISLEELDGSNRSYKLGKAIFTPFTSHDGGYVGADDKGYQIILNYRGTQNTFTTYSMVDVMAGRVPENWGRDRIVLIGVTAASLHDDFFTPYSSSLNAFPERTPGVVIHANLASQILSAALNGRPGINTWPDVIEWLWIMGWSFVGAILGWTVRSQKVFDYYITFKGTLAAVFLTGFILLGGCYQAFMLGWWLPVVPPLLSMGGSAVVVAVYVAGLERQDREIMMSLFRRHVTPQVAEVIWMSRHNLLKRGSIVAQEMTATVLFSDLEGFTTIASRMAPAALMVWLNEYMQAMAQLVLEYNGVVNKFIGDAVMALFGVPVPRTTVQEIAEDAENAVACALAMADKVRFLNQQWQLTGRPTIAIRIGIATGTVVTGSLGSSQRLEYTALGDTVNVAARLESYDKSFACGLCRILVNEETYQYIKHKFNTQFIGSFQLKGREEFTNIYQVLQADNFSLNDPINPKKS